MNGGVGTKIGLPLSAHRLFRTTDLDEARAIVGRKFCAHRLERQARTDRFDACHHRAEGLGLSLNFIRYGADVEIEPGELESFYLIQVPLRGQARVANGRDRVDTGNGIASILNPHRHTRMRWRAGCEMLLLQIDRHRLTETAERITGRSLPAPVRFSTRIDPTVNGMGRWIADLLACTRAAENSLLFGDREPLTQALVEDQLVCRLLHRQPSNLTPLLDVPRAEAPAAYVRRAQRYIRDRLADPITLTGIAEAVGVTPRSLQLGFRASFGLTPFQYVQHERLNQARFLLAESNGDSRVCDVAEQAGFAHLGRFAGAYKARFGETPLETLRRT